ncbi:MAG: thioesterase family protein [Kofleriaceae bacterium]
MYADLAADTAVRADEETPGRYHLTLPDHWDYLAPSGGVVMTCALRAALAAALAPEPESGLKLVSATMLFCSPVESGALISDVTVLRRGRGTTQVRAALRHAKRSDTACEVLATFMRERKGPDVRGTGFPAVRSLTDALPVDDEVPANPHNRFRFYQQLECRIAEGQRYWADGFIAGPARYARWFRFRTPQRDADGNLDRLALPPLIDTMPTALHRAIGPIGYRFYAPSLDLTTCVIDDTRRDWVLVATSLQRARGGWAIADAEVWDDEGRYLAFGSQAIYLHGLAGDPPTIDASSRT